MRITPSRVAGVILAVALILTPAVFARAEPPSVSIEEPEVGENVSKDARRHLDIERLWAELESAFLATRKLRVLTREKAVVGDRGAEQQRDDAGLANGQTAAAAEIGNPVYLLLAEVRNFEFTRSAKPLPNFASKYRRKDSGLLQLTAQMVNATRGEVGATFDLSSRFSTRSQVVNTEAGAPNSEHFTAMARDVATQLADQFVAAVYPMRVVKRTRGDQVIINRGDDEGIELGETLEVFALAQALIDPDTGRSLGPGEAYVGKVQVVHISPTVTYAKIVSEVDPLDAPIIAGDIVRRPRQE